MRSGKARSSVSSGSIALIRAMVGLVFLSEGIQKLLFADKLGSGRFAKIGLPWPDVLGPLVGSIEIICGGLILLGLYTRKASLPLIVIMVMAICFTKIPIFADQGLWEGLHESRTDWCMLIGSIFLLRNGPGKWALNSA